MEIEVSLLLIQMLFDMFSAKAKLVVLRWGDITASTSLNLFAN